MPDSQTQRLKLVIASGAKHSMESARPRKLECFVAFAPRNDGLSFLSLPLCGVETSEARSGVAHRERRERCAERGLFHPSAELPHPALRATLRASFARLDPTKIGGGKEDRQCGLHCTQQQRT